MASLVETSQTTVDVISNMTTDLRDHTLRMVTMVEADFALSGTSLSPDRASLTDYTKGFFYDEVVLLVSRSTAEAGWTFFLQPFHWLVYTVIGVSLMLVTALHVCLARCGAREDCSQRTSAGLGSSVVGALEASFGALLGRARCFASRTLMSAWLLTSLVTVVAYTAKLTALSVVVKEELPFNTLRQLVRQDEYRWGVEVGTMLNSVLSASNNEDYRRYYIGALKFAEEDPSALSSDMKEQAAKVAAGRYVYMTASSVYHRF
ncbi:hypothetical protein BaRGS_00016450 [Batillaria attramentaria]|uniref:Ionotropic glutamate receptor C-terminal domain-containing protein n=1 Tax=Batillaria attramentaria TaxID=370345 RepID=A0ABD0KYI5_9CAEN